MDGLSQLAQLGHLLRASANAARQIARNEVESAGEILWIAFQIEELSDEILQVSARQASGPFGNIGPTNGRPQ